MLLLDSALEVAGLTVFADHADPHTHHYLPGDPRLVMDDAGRPGLGLLLYRGGADGGLLTLDVELSVPPERLAALSGALRTRTGQEVNLVPVLFDHGTVRLTALGGTGDASPGLVEHVLGTATPNLAGGGRAIFSAELSAEGAVAMREAVRTRRLPAAVAYELGFTGLRPAAGLRVEIDHAMAYEHLRARFAPGALVFKADLDRETEALVREGHVRIEDVDYTGSDPAVLASRREDALRVIGEINETLLFRPATAPATLADRLPAPAAAGWGAAGRPRLAFTLRSATQQEQQTLTYDLRVTAPAARTIAPQAAVEIPASADPEALVAHVDLRPPPDERVTAAAAPGSDWSGVAAVEVQLRAGEATETLTLTAEAPEAAATLGGEVEVRSRALVQDEPGAIGAPAPPAAFAPAAARTILLDPAAVAQRRVLPVVLGAIDPEIVTSVTCTLAAGGRSRSVVLTAQEPESSVVVLGQEPVTVTCDWVTAAGPVRTEGAPAGLARTLVLDLPGDRFRTLTAIMQDPLERLVSIDVELQSSAADPPRRLSLGAAAPSARWLRARPPGDDGRFRYRTTTVARDASVAESDWAVGTGSMLPLGDLEVRSEAIDVVVTGWPAGAIGLQLRLSPADPAPGARATTSLVLEPPATRATLRLAFRSDADRRYSVAGEFFLESGSLPLPAREEVSEVLLIAPEGSAID